MSHSFPHKILEQGLHLYVEYCGGKSTLNCHFLVGNSFLIPMGLVVFFPMILALAMFCQDISVWVSSLTLHGIQRALSVYILGSGNAFAHDIWVGVGLS